MITVFRRLREKLVRENNIRRYLVYAVGEILLVVIGILLALQVNNWNEERIRQESIQSYIKAMASDLEKDLIEIDIRMEQIEARSKDLERLTDYVRDRKINEIQNEDLFILVRSSYSYRAYVWYRSSYDEITNSGSMKDIGNSGLREKIVAYYELAEHMLDDYAKDMLVAEKIHDLADQIININYSNEIRVFRRNNELNKQPYEQWVASADYRELKRLDYPLLVQDKSKLNEFVNKSFRLRNELETRTDNELPRMKAQAQEIIELINTVYND